MVRDIYFFKATLVAYGSYKARGQIRAVVISQPRQHQIQATSGAYATACGNAGSLTH